MSTVALKIGILVLLIGIVLLRITRRGNDAESYVLQCRALNRQLERNPFGCLAKPAV